jgi:hypothetical protein
LWQQFETCPKPLLEFHEKLDDDEAMKLGAQNERGYRSSPIRLSPIIGESSLDFRQLANFHGVYWRKFI